MTNTFRTALYLSAALALGAANLPANAQPYGPGPGGRGPGGPAGERWDPA
jgi:hypothetical protein